MTTVVQSTHTVRDMMLRIKGVEAVEKHRIGRDQWMLIAKKGQEAYVKKALEEELDILYKTQMGQRRLIMIGNKPIRNKSNTGNGVSTYAEILAKKYSKVEKTIQDKQANPAPPENTETKKPTTDKQVKERPRREIKDIPNNTSQQDNAKSDNSRNKLLEIKIKQMEETQKKLLDTQQELLKVQKQQEQVDKNDTKQAENKNQQHH